MAGQQPQSSVAAAATAVLDDNRRPLHRSKSDAYKSCLFVADFEKISAFAFYGELPHAPSHDPLNGDENAPSASSPSDSNSEAQNGSNSGTEPDDNDQEMIDLSQRQPSKFQEALNLEVRS
jgi:hypothetical protein